VKNPILSNSSSLLACQAAPPFVLSTLIPAPRGRDGATIAKSLCFPLCAKTRRRAKELALSWRWFFLSRLGAVVCSRGSYLLFLKK